MIDDIIVMSSLETSASGNILRYKIQRYKINNILFESFAIKSIKKIGAKECKIKLQ